MINNLHYVNRIIKIISPITFQTFKIELNGEENELRELMATILEINPNSIKGIRDSYDNYYTLSSAIENPNINISPNNYYTIVIKDQNINNLKYSTYMKYPSYNFRNERINTFKKCNNDFFNNTFDYSDKNLNKYTNNRTYEFINFADALYNNGYLDYSLVKKLKKLF